MVKQHTNPPETGASTKDAQKKKAFSLLRTTKNAASGGRRLIPFNNRRFVKQQEVGPKVGPPIRQVSFTSGGAGSGKERSGQGDDSHVSSLTDRDGMKHSGAAAAATVEAEQNTQSSISSKSSAFSYSKIGNEKNMITSDMKLFSKQTTMPQLELGKKTSKKPPSPVEEPFGSTKAPVTSPATVESELARGKKESHPALSSPHWTPNNAQPPKSPGNHVDNSDPFQTQPVPLSDSPDENREDNRTDGNDSAMDKTHSVVAPSTDAASKGKRSPGKQKKKKKSKTSEARENSGRESPPHENSESAPPPPPPPPPTDKQHPVSESEKKLAFERIRALLSRVNPRGSRHDDFTTPRVDNTAQGQARRLPVDPAPGSAKSPPKHETEVVKPRTYRDPSPVGHMTHNNSHARSPVFAEETALSQTRTHETTDDPGTGGGKRVSADPPSSPVVERKAIDAPPTERGHDAIPDVRGKESFHADQENNELFPDILGQVGNDERILADPQQKTAPAERAVVPYEAPKQTSESSSAEKVTDYLDKRQDHVKSPKEKSDPAPQSEVTDYYDLRQGPGKTPNENIAPEPKREGTDCLDKHQEPATAKSPNENVNPTPKVEVTKKDDILSVKPRDEKWSKDTPSRFVFDDESSYPESPETKKMESRQSIERKPNAMRLRVLQSSVAPRNRGRQSIESAGSAERNVEHEVESSDDEIPAPAIDTAAMLAALESSLPPRKASKGSTSPKKKIKSRRKKGTGSVTTVPSDYQKSLHQKANAIAEKHTEKKRLSSGKVKAEKRLAASKALSRGKANDEIQSLPTAPDALPDTISVTKHDPISDLDSVRNTTSAHVIKPTMRDDFEAISMVESNDDDHDRYAPLFTVLTPDSPIQEKTKQNDILDKNCVTKTQGSTEEDNGRKKSNALADEITEWTADSAIDEVEMVIQPRAKDLPKDLTVSSPCSINHVLECLALDETENTGLANSEIQHEAERPDKVTTFGNDLASQSQPSVRICEADDVLEILALDSKTVEVSEGGLLLDFPTTRGQGKSANEVPKAIQTPGLAEPGTVSTFLRESPTGVGVEVTKSQQPLFPTSTEQTNKMENSENIAPKKDTREVEPGPDDSSKFGKDEIVGEKTSFEDSERVSGTRHHSMERLAIFLASSAETGPPMRLASSVETGPVLNQPVDSDSSDTESRKSNFRSPVQESGREESETESSGMKERITQCSSKVAVEDASSDESCPIRNEPSGVVVDASEDKTIHSVPWDPTGMLPIHSVEDGDNSIADDNIEMKSSESGFSDQESRDMSIVPQKSPDSVELDCSVEPSDDSRTKLPVKSKIEQIMAFGQQAANLSPNSTLELSRRVGKLDDEAKSILQKSIQIAEQTSAGKRINASGEKEAELIDLTSYASSDEVDEAVWLFDIASSVNAVNLEDDHESETESIMDLAALNIGEITDDRTSALDSVIKYAAMILDEQSADKVQIADMTDVQSRDEGLFVPSLSVTAPSRDLKLSDDTRSCPSDNSSGDETPQVLLVVEGHDVASCESREVSDPVLITDATVIAAKESLPKKHFPNGRVWQQCDLFPISEDIEQVQENETGMAEVGNMANQAAGNKSANFSAFVPAVYPEKLQHRKSVAAKHPLHTVISLEEERSRTSTLTEEHHLAHASRTGVIPEEPFSTETLNASGCESPTCPSAKVRVKPSPELPPNERAPIPNKSKKTPTSRFTPESFSLATHKPADARSTGDTQLFNRDDLDSVDKSSLVLSDSGLDSRSEENSVDADSVELLGDPDTSVSVPNENTVLFRRPEVFDCSELSEATRDSQNMDGFMRNRSRSVPRPESATRIIPNERCRVHEECRQRPVSECSEQSTREYRQANSPDERRDEQTSIREIQHLEAGSLVVAICSTASSESFEVVEWMPSVERAETVVERQLSDVEEATQSSVLVDPMVVPVDEGLEKLRKGSFRDSTDTQDSSVVGEGFPIQTTRDGTIHDQEEPIFVVGHPVPVELPGKKSPSQFSEPTSEAVRNDSVKAPVTKDALEDNDACSKVSETERTKIYNQARRKDVVGSRASDPVDEEFPSGKRKKRYPYESKPLSSNSSEGSSGKTPKENKIHVEMPKMKNESDGRAGFYSTRKTPAEGTASYKDGRIPSDGRAGFYSTRKTPAEGIASYKDGCIPSDGRACLYSTRKTLAEGTASFKDGRSPVVRPSCGDVENRKAMRTPEDQDLLDYFFQGAETVLCGGSKTETPLLKSDDRVFSFDKNMDQQPEDNGTNCAVASQNDKKNGQHRRDIIDTVFEGAEALLCLDDDHCQEGVCLRSMKGGNSRDKYREEQVPFADALGPVALDSLKLSTADVAKEKMMIVALTENDTRVFENDSKHSDGKASRDFCCTETQNSTENDVRFSGKDDLSHSGREASSECSCAEFQKKREETVRQLDDGTRISEKTKKTNSRSSLQGETKKDTSQLRSSYGVIVEKGVDDAQENQQDVVPSQSTAIVQEKDVTPGHIVVKGVDIAQENQQDVLPSQSTAIVQGKDVTPGHVSPNASMIQKGASTVFEHFNSDTCSNSAKSTEYDRDPPISQDAPPIDDTPRKEQAVLDLLTDNEEKCSDGAKSTEYDRDPPISQDAPPIDDTPRKEQAALDLLTDNEDKCSNSEKSTEFDRVPAISQDAPPIDDTLTKEQAALYLLTDHEDNDHETLEKPNEMTPLPSAADALSRPNTERTEGPRSALAVPSEEASDPDDGQEVSPSRGGTIFSPADSSILFDFSKSDEEDGSGDGDEQTCPDPTETVHGAATKESDDGPHRGLNTDGTSHRGPTETVDDTATQPSGDDTQRQLNINEISTYTNAVRLPDVEDKITQSRYLDDTRDNPGTTTSAPFGVPDSTTVNRGVDPPTIVDSSTQQTTSFESSDKGLTFETTTYDDTIPSKPVIIPDFPSRSDDNILSNREGVEVSVYPNASQTGVSECLSITTEPDRSDSLASFPFFRRRAIDAPSPRRVMPSPLRRGLDPPPYEGSPGELPPLPEDPPSGEDGLGRAWSQESGSTSDRSRSSDEPIVVVPVRVAVVAGTDVNKKGNDTTARASFIGAVVPASDVRDAVQKNNLMEADKEAFPGSDANNRGDSDIGIGGPGEAGLLQPSSPVSYGNTRQRTDHSACTDRVLNRGPRSTEKDSVTSLQDDEPEETEEGVEVSIKPPGYTGSDSMEDTKEDVIGISEEETRVNAVGAGTSESGEVENERDGKTSTVTPEAVSNDKVSEARASALEEPEKKNRQPLSLQSSGILEQTGSSVIFPLVAQLTDSSWCMATSQVFHSNQDALPELDQTPQFISLPRHSSDNTSQEISEKCEVQVKEITVEVSAPQKTNGSGLAFGGNVSFSPGNKADREADVDNSREKEHSPGQSRGINNARRRTSRAFEPTRARNDNVSESETSRSINMATSSSGSSAGDRQTSDSGSAKFVKYAYQMKASNTDDTGIVEPMSEKAPNTKNTDGSISVDTEDGKRDQYGSKLGNTSPSQTLTISEKEAQVKIESDSSSQCKNDEDLAFSVSSEPNTNTSSPEGRMSRVERVRAMAERQGFVRGFRNTNDGMQGSVSSEPESLIAPPKDKLRVNSRFSRSPQLQNVLDRLRNRNQNSKGESSSADSIGTEPVDVDDLFSRYDSIVKNMVVNDKAKLDRIQRRETTTHHTISRQTPDRTAVIDVTYLGSSDGGKPMMGDNASVSDLRASPKRQNELFNRQYPQAPTSGSGRNPIIKSNSFSSASEFSVTPSQKARELRQQLDQALKTSVAIRTTQEKLNSEISTFKSRLQWQSHLSPHSLSPRRSNSTSDVPLLGTAIAESDEAYVSLAELQKQQTELRTEDEVMRSDRDDEVDYDCSGPESEDSDDIRSHQVDSILTGLAQATSPKSAVRSTSRSRDN